MRVLKCLRRQRPAAVAVAARHLASIDAHHVDRQVLELANLRTPGAQPAEEPVDVVVVRGQRPRGQAVALPLQPELVVGVIERRPPPPGAVPWRTCAVTSAASVRLARSGTGQA